MKFLLSVLCLLLQQIFVYSSDIDDYVNKLDENYGWVYMGEETNLYGRDLKGEHSWTGYVLNVTSQR